VAQQSVGVGEAHRKGKDSSPGQQLGYPFFSRFGKQKKENYSAKSQNWKNGERLLEELTKSRGKNQKEKFDNENGDWTKTKHRPCSQPTNSVWRRAGELGVAVVGGVIRNARHPTPNKNGACEKRNPVKPKKKHTERKGKKRKGSKYLGGKDTIKKKKKNYGLILERATGTAV